MWPSRSSKQAEEEDDEVFSEAWGDYSQRGDGDADELHTGRT